MAPTSQHGDVRTLLQESLADPGTAWSLGCFGAVAEFMRDPDETTSALPDRRLGMKTERGAIALAPGRDLRPVAYETAFASGWSHAVALCLPTAGCAMSRRAVVTELGPDRAAAGREDQGAILFDLGLDLLAIDACVRTRDPAVIDCLRSGAGRSLLDPESPVGRCLVATSPHRVFLARVGRIEVYTPIPGCGAGSPAGPRTVISPQVLRSGRTHATTTPIPRGWVPCGGIHPAHPCKDRMGRRIAFDIGRHDAFQRLLERWGDPDLLAAKRGSPGPDGSASGRHVRSARRVFELQATYLRGERADRADRVDADGARQGSLSGQD